MITTEVSVVMAFLAGLVSFLSPCVLPIVPGYLSMVSGLTMEEIENAGGAEYRRIVWTTALFVLGFTLVFVALGASATSIGFYLTTMKTQLTYVAGGLIILFGLFVMGALKIPFLYREARFAFHDSRWGFFAIPLLGMAFAFGWTPCIGPILSSILLVASVQDTVAKGAGLLLLYAIGLGVPFILSGLLFARALSVFAWVRKHHRTIMVVSGGLMVLFGVALITGQVTYLNIWLQKYMPFTFSI